MKNITVCFFPIHYSDQLFYIDPEKANEFNLLVSNVTEKINNYSGLAITENNKYQFQRIIDKLNLPFTILDICSFCGYYEIEIPFR